jgi:hypothetical protein
VLPVQGTQAGGSFRSSGEDTVIYSIVVVVVVVVRNEEHTFNEHFLLLD